MGKSQIQRVIIWLVSWHFLGNALVEKHRNLTDYGTLLFYAELTPSLHCLCDKLICHKKLCLLNFHFASSF